MKKAADLTDLSERVEELAAALAYKARARAGPGEAPPPALGDDYWQSLQDLFIQGVTLHGLRQLVEHETQETFRFFTREIDFEALRGRPWYDKYPRSAWKVFLAMAHRLSPPRRILFAVAVPILVAAWVLYFLERGPFSWTLDLGLLAGTVVLLLLLLELRDKLALKGDLEVARQIQFGLLPFGPFARDGLEVNASMRPANTVGGDYFDLVELGGGRVALVLGDVAGKGMPAALLMALLQGSLRTLVSAGFRGPELVSKLNDHLQANIPSNRLITLFYSEADPASGTIEYVNAGHNPPFLLRAGGAIERLDPTGMALGIIVDSPFDARTIRLALGDRLFLYTDGITEAENAADDQYGEERLRAFLAPRTAVPGEALLDAVVGDVLAHCGTARPRDDMTVMLVARRYPPPPPPR
jgi:serine phosphatase RsbU (regulator of sigma subunit)